MVIERRITELSAVGGELSSTNYGAQVLSWTPSSGLPVIQTSPLSDPATAHSIRGGIPLCFPWFGRADRSHIDLPQKAPAHGFARNSVWETIECTEYSIHYRLVHAADPHAPADSPAAIFPHSFVADMQITLSSDLILTFSVLNTDNHEWDFEAAFHSYITVGDVKDILLFGLQDAPYMDALTDVSRTQHEYDLCFVRQTDRVYRSDASMTLVDPRFRRRLLIDTDNTGSVVVWVPWHEGVAALPDMPQECWECCVCVEVGNIWDDKISLQPGQTHTMTMRISSEDLS